MSQQHRIVSFDIGTKNLAHYIEDIDLTSLNSLATEVCSKKSPEYPSFLEKVALTGKRVDVGVYDVGGDDKISLSIQVRKNIIKHLDTFKHIYETCNEIVIERQYFRTYEIGKKKSKKGSEANVNAIKVAEVVLTWFLMNFPDITSSFIPATDKTTLLNAPPKLSKPARKKWSVAYAKHLHTVKNDVPFTDIFTLHEFSKFKRVDTPEKVSKILSTYKHEECKDLAYFIVSKKQKLDDVSDAYCQLQAHKVKRVTT